MANKGRVLTAVAAVATSAALLLSGTFAWQSISQRALNEASDVINPGGRLHDDFNGENKDVYVENFAEEPIYARIRLGEYFEIIANYGKEGVESSTQVLGSKNEDDTYNYDPFYFDGNVDGDGVVTAGSGYWSWQTGGETVYMPTFNMNKDSLAADINGIYEDGNVGTISKRVLDLDADDAQYSQYTEYTDGETLDGTEIYDADSNDIEDENTTTVEATHTAKATEYGELISMAEWDGTAGPYWVYDTDGWVYWAQAIEPGTATGLLLDGIALNQVMDDTWYYAIEVVAQFVTADDVGKADSSGFYADGNAPTAEAEELLREIGVTSVDDEFTGEDEPGNDESEYDHILKLRPDGSESIYASDYDFIKLEIYDNAGEQITDMTGITVQIEGPSLEADDYHYNEDDQTMELFAFDTQDITVKAVDDEGSIIASGTIHLNPQAPETNTSLMLDGVNRNQVSPGNEYTLEYNGSESDGYTYEITTGASAASIEGDTLTINGDAPRFTYITITVKNADGETVDTASVMVSHDITFLVKQTGQPLGPNGEIEVGKTLMAKMGDDIVLPMNISMGADTEYADGITVNDDFTEITFTKGDIYVSADATYAHEGKIVATDSAFVNSVWLKSVEVSYSINGGENKNADSFETIFLSADDTITFTATSTDSSGEMGPVRWFIGEHGNTGTENSDAFGPLEYGTLDHTDATYTIPNITEMEWMLDYCFYVSAEEHNYAYFDVIYGEPAILLDDPFPAGGSDFLSVNDWKDYTYAITAGTEYGEIIDGNEFHVYSNAPEGATITVTATPDGHDGSVLTKTITIGPAEEDDRETFEQYNDPIVLDLMQLKDARLDILDENGELVEDVEKTNIYNMLYVEGDDAACVGFSNNVDATPDATLWLMNRMNAENGELWLECAINAEPGEYNFTLVYAVEDYENNTVTYVYNPVELTVTETPLRLTGPTEVAKGGTYEYTLTLPADVNTDSVSGNISGSVDGNYVSNFTLAENKQSATLTVPADETNDYLQLWIGCDLTDGTNYAYYLDVTVTDAPVVAIEAHGASSYDHYITISGLEDDDYPLTVRTYNMENDAAYEEGTLQDEMIINKTADGVTMEKEPKYAYEIEEADGVITITYNFAFGEDEGTYLGVTVTDKFGNVGKGSQWIQTLQGCFVAGTQVQTENGLADIEDIRVGDMVYSYDLNSNTKVLRPVVWVQGERYIDATYTVCAAGNEIVTTYEHPFYVIGKGWVAAEELAAGDKLMDMNGDAVEISDVVYTKLDKPVRVYNFMVDDTHNYFVGESGILAHNVQK